MVPLVSFHVSCVGYVVPPKCATAVTDYSNKVIEEFVFLSAAVVVVVVVVVVVIVNFLFREGSNVEVV